MTSIQRVGCVVGSVVLTLFVASIATSVVAPQDERCDNCLRMMVETARTDMPSLKYVLVEYRCLSCDQRGEKHVLDDGRVEWREW